MGWFDEQLRQRAAADDEAFRSAFAQMAGVVMGQSVVKALQDDSARSRDAIYAILKYYHIHPQEMPPSITETEDQLEFLLRPSGVMRRAVQLESGWQQNAIGPMLGTLANGCVTALLPRKTGGYEFLDPATGAFVRVNAGNAAQLQPEAICFYKPFPTRALHLRDLAVYLAQTLYPPDLVFFAVLTLAAVLTGMLLPKATAALLFVATNGAAPGFFAGAALLLVSVSLSQLLLHGAKSIMMARIRTRMDVAVQAAAMMRVLSLPPSFFRTMSAGELASRAQSINGLCGMLVETVLSTSLTSVFSLVYFAQIFTYAPALAAPALAVLAATVGFMLVSMAVQLRVTRQSMALEAAEYGMTYAMVSGVQKLRLAGAEKRAFARWASLYAKKARLLYDPPVLVKLSGVISLAITLTGTIVMYGCAARAGVSVTDYYAFNTAYGMLSGAFLSLAGAALAVAGLKPAYETVQPILRCTPEITPEKRMVTRLSGAIELNNVSFRYGENGPLILDDLSLKIRPGQYVAIVGRTGCGKSTLMRLLLGFETPQKGAVYFDGNDLARLDLKSLRRHIGTVMQDGKLFQGDIYSNIVISAPQLGMDAAFAAADMAGIGDDIRAMPMGMHTLISEGGGGISGGQRQRLMIARAVAAKPRVLLFDEATSALDNLTQKKVSDALATLKCTRIVIAHRLSTIQKCDRILVLDGGHIAEEGTYETLLQKNGLFAELVARQRLEQS